MNGLLTLLANDITDFLFPRYCIICGCKLTQSEEHICVACNMSLHRTNFHTQENNPVEQLFWGRIPIVNATSFFHYDSEGHRRLLHSIKYFSNPHLGKYLGKMLAEEIKNSGFFDEIDIIVPVPLHWIKRMKRGYNQSAFIAEGIHQATGIPIVTDAVKRIHNNKTQTLLEQHFQRWENVKDVFKLTKPDKLKGKHILIVDDVLTTGATTVACAQEIMKAGDVKFTVVSLAFAGH